MKWLINWSVFKAFLLILLDGAVCCACKQPGVFQLKDLCVNNVYKIVPMCPFKSQLNTWIIEKHFDPGKPRREVRCYKWCCSCCHSHPSPVSLVFTYWLHLCSPVPDLLLLFFNCYSWPCMLVLLIHHLGDAGTSCFSGKSKAMLYCFFLMKRKRRWGRAASLCPPRMLSSAAQFSHFHLSLLFNYHS